MDKSPRHPQDLIELAHYVGAYRKALYEQGLSEDLTNILVRDWHQKALTDDQQRVLRLADVEHISKA